jgi:hypothetical protein
VPEQAVQHLGGLRAERERLVEVEQRGVGVALADERQEALEVPVRDVGQVEAEQADQDEAEPLARPALVDDPARRGDDAARPAERRSARGSTSIANIRARMSGSRMYADRRSRRDRAGADPSRRRARP